MDNGSSSDVGRRLRLLLRLHIIVLGAHATIAEQNANNKRGIIIIWIAKIAIVLFVLHIILPSFMRKLSLHRYIGKDNNEIALLR
jgi:hypothetical protein